MKEVFRLSICNSHQPKQHGGGCCNDKRSELLIQAFREALSAHSLSQKLQIVETTCLKSCLSGISVRVLPQNVMLAQVKITDIPEILDSIESGTSLPKRLLAPSPSVIDRW